METSIIDNVIRDAIKVKIIQTLSENEHEMLNNLIEAAINRKVDSQGNDRSYNANIRFIDYITGTLLQRAIEDSVRQVLKERQVEILDEIRNHLGTATIAEQIAKVVGIRAFADYNINVEFKNT